VPMTSSLFLLCVRLCVRIFMVHFLLSFMHGIVPMLQDHTNIAISFQYYAFLL
jgi:hypothetical protein